MEVEVEVKAEVEVEVKVEVEVEVRVEVEEGRVLCRDWCCLARTVHLLCCWSLCGVLTLSISNSKFYGLLVNSCFLSNITGISNLRF